MSPCGASQEYSVCTWLSAGRDTRPSLDMASGARPGSARPSAGWQRGGPVNVLDDGARRGDPLEGVNLAAVDGAVARQAARPVEGVGDMASYLATQVGDASHRGALGPLLDGGAPSGVVVRRGTVLASWGDPSRVEMAFSATKSVLSLVAGVAYDDDLLRLDEPVCDSVDLPQFAGDHGAAITWRHLLDQTSQWEGELWASRLRSTRRAPARAPSRPAGRRARAGPTTTSA